MKSKRTRIVAVLAAAGAAAALIALSVDSGSDGRAARDVNAIRAARDAAPTVLTGSIDQTDRMWVCSGPVALDSVTVTMTTAAQAFPRTSQDAIHLESGCTGTIGSITIDQSAGDGLKVGNGAHDITIGGGTIRCLDKSPNLHQDGIQVMSGENISFQNLTVDCGRPGATQVNSDIFFNQGNGSTVPPTNVTCNGCRFSGGAAHTVSIQDSVGSGVTNSVLCPALYPKLTLSIGPNAVDPVSSSNQLVQCDTSGTPTSAPPATTTAPASTVPAASSRLTIAAPATVVTGGTSLLLGGALANGHSGRLVDVYAQPFDTAAERLVATTRTGIDGRWQLLVRPQVGTTYSARARSIASASLQVRVRPLVLLHAGTTRLTIQIRGTHGLTGTTVFIQRRQGSRWVTVGQAVLGPNSGAIFTPKLSSSGTVRASLPPHPGYLGATSTTVTLKGAR